MNPMLHQMAPTVTGGEPPQLFDIEGAARYSGWTIRALRELRATRQLEAIRLGRRLWFRRADIDRLIERSFAEQNGSI
jgi:hypothetical protein